MGQDALEKMSLQRNGTHENALAHSATPCTEQPRNEKLFLLSYHFRSLIDFVSTINAVRRLMVHSSFVVGFV